jgi:hypothetical protein
MVEAAHPSVPKLRDLQAREGQRIIKYCDPPLDESGFRSLSVGILIELESRASCALHAEKQFLRVFFSKWVIQTGISAPQMPQ